MISGQMFIEKTYSNCEELVHEILFRKDSLYTQPLLFRGEASATYKLTPSVLRMNANQKAWFVKNSNLNTDYQHSLIDAERHAINMFYKNADIRGLPVPKIQGIEFEHVFSKALKHNDIWIRDELLEIAGLAQHYGVPTRLIDWTFDPSVALYFAATNAMLRIRDKNDLDDFMILWVLNYPIVEIGRSTTKPLGIVIIKPPYFGNPNLAAQQGAFSLCQVQYPETDRKDSKTFIDVDYTPFDSLLIKRMYEMGLKEYPNNSYPILCRYSIPIGECFNLYKLLNNMGYNASRIFPGYGSIIKNFEEDSLAYR